MKDTPINYNVVKIKFEESNLSSISKASIREIKKLVDEIERATGEKYIRMEMGIPGLPPAQVGVDAEIAALKRGVASIYPDIQGIPELKKEASRFVKLFLNIDVNKEGCIPTVGSMQGSFAAFITVNRMYEEKDTVLFLDPGFPVHKQQISVLKQKSESFDVYDYRGEKLGDKLESILQKGNISAMLYSNPNNPSWICFTEEELKIIGELADKYEVVVLEDLAYVGMDFRKDLYTPGEPPYQATAARYTDNYILFISSSKAFSYAGQRIGMMIISDMLYNKRCPDLKKYYTSDLFGYAMIFGTVYPLSAGVTHSAQHALTAMYKAANNGEFNFVNEVKEYGGEVRTIALVDGYSTTELIRRIKED